MLSGINNNLTKIIAQWNIDIINLFVALPSNAMLVKEDGNYLIGKLVNLLFEISI